MTEQVMWKGRPLEEMSHGELLELIDELQVRINEAIADLARTRRAPGQRARPRRQT
jgi:hypothetical protein